MRCPGSNRTLIAAAMVMAACGGSPSAPDAAPDSKPDAPTFLYAACGELTRPTQIVSGLPAHLIGDVSGGGADLSAPTGCATSDDPFGVQTAGEDDVIALDGLQPGVDYVVRVDSAADLSFYVVTGCSSETGPVSHECL